MFNIDSSAVVGIVTSGVVQLLKYLPSVPLIAGQTTKIRTTAAVLSFLGTFGMAIATNDVSALTVIGGTIASFLVSHLTFVALFHNPNKPATSSTQQSGA